MLRKTRIAVLVSGGGTNLQALLDAQQSGILHSGEIALVLSSDPAAFALERAARAGVPAATVDVLQYPDPHDFEDELNKLLEQYDIDMLILAGFLCILSEEFTTQWDHKILNVHPSLIPAFCGPGMYGLFVHEAALERGVKLAGATVHYVNEITDGGEIILQKAVEVQPDDTPKTLQRRVMEQAEWIILPQAAELVAAKMAAEREAK